MQDNSRNTEVLLANPRGFCAGVERAIEIVERALVQFGAPIYVRHEIVHNRFVVENLRAKGAVFVDELDQVPTGGTVIFSAHGVAKAVRANAEARGLRVFDATCPLVTKVHVEVAKMLAAGLEVVMIGHRGHPEAEGTMGQAAQGMHLVETVDDVATLAVRDPAKLAYVTQTTLSVDDARMIVAALRKRFPAIRGPKKDDICYATALPRPFLLPPSTWGSGKSPGYMPPGCLWERPTPSCCSFRSSRYCPFQLPSPSARKIPGAQ